MQTVSYNTFCLKRNQLMMEQPLPSQFEIIVIGTGLEESILAAAAARNGHSVLHLDTNDYYGGNWAAFTFDGMQDWIKKSLNNAEEGRKQKPDSLQDHEEVLGFLSATGISGVIENWYVADEESNEKTPPGQESENHQQNEATADQEPKEDNREVHPKHGKPAWTKNKILEKSRHFNLDLTPKLLFARGSMVELLISSNVARYTEFKSASRVLTMINGMLEYVPSSRADVFTTKHVSVVEKRILMKFLTSCMENETAMPEEERFANKTYVEYLRHKKLTDNLIHFVVNSIAMVKKDASCSEGIAATKKFLSSLGRFGNTPFLWSMYGSGELPQAFCRLCAVFGGTYYLGRSVDSLIFSSKKQRCSGVVTDGKRIDCDYLVLPGSLCPEQLKSLDQDMGFLKRSICLLSDSVMPSEKEQLTFISLPPDESNTSSNFTFCQEVGHGAAACPTSMYCLHSTTIANTPNDPERQTENYSETLIDVIPNAKSKKLWELKFNIESKTWSSKNIQNVFLTRDAFFELDYDLNIERCKTIYQQIYPGEEFLPKAPEPEEIIMGEEGDKENPEEEQTKACQQVEEQPGRDGDAQGKEKDKDSADK